MAEIKLGSKVRDVVNGFEGIATSKTEYLNGCVRYGVTPKVDKDGKPQDAHFIDVQQIEVIEEPNVKVEPKKTGGPQGKNPPQN